MRRPQFQPKLFVGIGETMAFFTLRETYLHETFVASEGPMGGAVVNGVYQGEVITEVRSFHHFNLSQDADEAIVKAKEASLKLGLPFFCTKETIEQEMREIKVRTAEQIEADNRRAEEAIRADEERRYEFRLMSEAEKIECFDCNQRMPNGAYVLNHVSSLPREYCTWVVENKENFEHFSFMLHLANYIEAKLPEKILKSIKLKPRTYFGEVGKRYDLELTVIKCFGFEGHFGRTYVTTMADSKGICFNVMSGAFSAAAGDVIKCKGTVKSHTPYKGQAQTVLNRVKVLETA